MNLLRDSTRGRWFRKYSISLGILLSFSGIVVLYLVAYGRHLFYTQTYHTLARALPPAVDVWTLISGLSIPFMLAWLAIMPHGKLRAISFSQRRRRLLGAIGLIVTGLAALFVITGKVFEYPWMTKLLSQSLVYFGLIYFGALGLIAFTFAIYPTSISEKFARVTGKVRALAGISALILTVLFAAALEAELTKSTIRQNVVPVSHAPRPAPTHSISVILKDYPRNLSSGEAVPLALRFRLTPYRPAETGPRFPISLDSTRRYTVSASMKALGFEVVPPNAHVLNPRPLNIGQAYEWTWLVSPKPESSGTTQSLLFDVFLHDARTEAVIFEAPVTTLRVEVGTLLGLPRWLISPQLGLGAILGGLLSILLPWLLEQFGKKRGDGKQEARLIVSDRS